MTFDEMSCTRTKRIMVSGQRSKWELKLLQNNSLSDVVANT